MSTKLRVFSYNIHKGFSSIARKYTLHKMRDELRRLHPDIIFLQEVHGHHSGHKNRVPEWPDLSQFEFLAEELWPHFTYGKNVIYTKGHHGNAILSKWPIKSWENVDISHYNFEKRGALHTTLELTTGRPPLHAICLHLSLFEKARKAQLLNLKLRVEKIIKTNEPVIIAGDFNDWRENANEVLVNKLGFKETFQEIQGEHATTFPVFFPLLNLDRIYFKGLKVTSATCHANYPWNKLSDHSPIEAELQTL